MSITKSFSLLGLFKVLHGWLGILIFPWVIVIGLTGLFLNHHEFFSSYLPDSSYDEAQFDQWPNPIPLTEASARAVAAGIWPNDQFRLRSREQYHDRAVYNYLKDDDQVIVVAATGHYWVKTRLSRKTYDPDGRLLDRKIYWGSLFSSLHRRGWATNSFGTWIADVTAVALLVFGITGIVLFLSARVGRRRDKPEKPPALKSKKAPAAADPPRPQRIKLEV